MVKNHSCLILDIIFIMVQREIRYFCGKIFNLLMHFQITCLRKYLLRFIKRKEDPKQRDGTVTALLPVTAVLPALRMLPCGCEHSGYKENKRVIYTDTTSLCNYRRK